MQALFEEWLKLAEHIGTVCVAEKRVVAGAESCTGGLIAAVLMLQTLYFKFMESYSCWLTLKFTKPEKDLKVCKLTTYTIK